MNPPSTPPYAVIFDLDGVLIDSVPLNWQAYNQILAGYGIEMAKDDIARYMGRPLRSTIRSLNARFGKHINAREFEAQASIIEEPLFRNLEPKPGAKSLMAALHAAGVPVAIGTSTPHPLAVKRLKVAGIYQYIKTVVGEGDVESHKPDPDVFLHAAKRLRIRPRRCVVFEDAPAGVAAAKAAGMRCCAVTGQFTSAADLELADLIVDSLTRVTPAQIHQLLTDN